MSNAKNENYRSRAQHLISTTSIFFGLDVEQMNSAITTSDYCISKHLVILTYYDQRILGDIESGCISLFMSFTMKRSKLREIGLLIARLC